MIKYKNFQLLKADKHSGGRLILTVKRNPNFRNYLSLDFSSNTFRVIECKELYKKGKECNYYPVEYDAYGLERMFEYFYNRLLWGDKID